MSTVQNPRLLSRNEQGLRCVVAWCARALGLLAAAIVAMAPLSAAQTEPLTIETAKGRFVYHVEIADTESKRRTGLMYRKSMPADHGMLFGYDDERVITMWMRNTYISLDMIFITADGRVATVAANTEPLSERIISSGVPVIAVLEVNAGTARRIGLKSGDRVVQRMFER